MTIRVTYNTEDIATYISLSYENPAIDAVWGQITGTLSNQTDLQLALDGKFDDPTGTTAQYIRGDGTLATFPSLTGYVPYTGATTNVNLGEFELKAGQMTLDITPTGTAAVGTTRWNDTIGSSETTLKGGSVILKNGVDLVARVVNKVSPNTTLTKAAYQAVRISGAQGQRLAVALAQANNDNNSADTIGLVTETIATNQEGFIMTVGSLESINTTGSLQGETWADGDVIYLSPTTAGALTNVKPIAPQHIIIIGYVEYAHANNGKLYVKVMNGWELGELHDVDTTGATAGQVLKYNGTIWTPSGDVGITSLNGLNATTQTFATGTSGTDFNISSATSTHTFNLPTASGTNRGLLSSADWTTFNSKQNALTNPITGTAASGQVAYFTGSTTQAGSNNLFWDNANGRLGIGLSVPSVRLEVSVTGNNGIRIANTGNTSSDFSVLDFVQGGSQKAVIYTNNNNTIFNATSGALIFQEGGAEAARIFGTGRFGINTGATDYGQMLQVVGTGYFSDSVGIGSTSLAGTNLRITKTITGSTSPISVYVDGVIQSDATNSPNGFATTLGTQAASFTVSNIRHFNASQGTFGAGSTVTNQFGFVADNTLTGATNNYGFYGNIPSGTGRWNLYMNGTAANYLAGVTQIGAGTLTSEQLQVNGTAKITGATTISSSVAGNFSSLTLQNSSSATNARNILQFSNDAGSVGLIDGFSSTWTASGGGDDVANGFRFLSQGAGGLSLRVSAAAATMRFYTGSTERMRLDANGNLGIGTTTPTILNYGVELVVSGANKTAQPEGFLIIQGARNSNSNIGGLLFYNSSSSIASIGAQRIDENNSGRLIFSVYSSGTINSNTILHKTGNFALGSGATTDSGERLQVNGTAKITGATGANNLLTFTNGTNTDYLYLDNNGFGLFSGASATGNGFYIRGNNIIDFYINSSIALRLDSTGSLNVGSSSANSTAVLQADSTSKGFLPPRMTTTQKNAISSPAAGLMVYDTTLNKLCVFTTAWETITSL